MARKRGRPSKGDRLSMTLRPMRSMGVGERAEAAGYTSPAQFILDELAEKWGCPEYIVGPNEVNQKMQEELPLELLAEMAKTA